MLSCHVNSQLENNKNAPDRNTGSDARVGRLSGDTKSPSELTTRKYIKNAPDHQSGSDAKREIPSRHLN